MSASCNAPTTPAGPATSGDAHAPPAAPRRWLNTRRSCAGSDRGPGPAGLALQGERRGPLPEPGATAGGRGEQGTRGRPDERMYAWLHRNSASPTAYVNLPIERVVTLATVIDL